MSLHVSALLSDCGDLIVRQLRGSDSRVSSSTKPKNNGGEVFMMHTHTKKSVSTWVWPARSEIFVFGEPKQKDFCQTREVLTLACSDVGGLALTFDLAIVFAPPRPACGDPPLLRPWFWEQQESRRLRTVPAGLEPAIF